jgi:isopentenyl diphosphate isomerase/L-lactate dehydrogenase-like FMN-dependent dehydrogenase
VDDARPVNLHELEPLARERLTEQAYAYVRGGSGDEHSLRWNIEAWNRLRLSPHFLSTSRRSTRG